ncbi:MAG: transporter substrate-binding domain-containing protein [Treponemataceae bacterium]
MKKMIIALTIIVSLSTFLSCEKRNVSTLERIKKEGKVIVGTTTGNPPFGFHISRNGKDTIAGFDIKIAQEIANDLGVELKISDIAFEGLLPALVANKIDIIVAGLAPTEERKQNVDFSILYHTSMDGAVIRRADKDKYAASRSSLKNIVVGAEKSSLQVEIAKTQIKGMSKADLQNNHPEVKELESVSDLIMALKTKKIDAVIAEIPVANFYLQKHPDLMVADYEFDFVGEGSAIAIKKGNQDLVDKINETLEKLISQNKIEEFERDATILAGEL